MQQQNTSKSRKASSSRTTAPKKTARPQKTDKLAPYRAQAAKFIKLYFDPNVPDFVSDLISSLLSELENETQCFWNTREIAEVAFPLMFREAARLGIDIESRYSALILDAHQASVTTNDREGRYRPRPSVSDEQQTELENDADAISRLLNSKYAPAQIINALAKAVDEFTDTVHDDSSVLRVAYPLAVLREREQEKASKPCSERKV